jgi:hypothetical protein
VCGGREDGKRGRTTPIAGQDNNATFETQSLWQFSTGYCDGKALSSPVCYPLQDSLKKIRGSLILQNNEEKGNRRIAILPMCVCDVQKTESHRQGFLYAFSL